MAKIKPSNTPQRPAELSDLARNLLRAMASDPGRIEYNTRVLGGSFKEPDVERLDSAYQELAEQGLIERAGAVVSFFGHPKSLYRITQTGKEAAGSAA